MILLPLSDVFMIEIPFSNRTPLTPLFANHTRQRVLIDAILEQPYGQAFADSESDPQIARLQLGVFKIFAGDANHALAQQTIKTCPGGLLIAESDAWRVRILGLIGEHCTTYLRTGFSFEKLNRTHIGKRPMPMRKACSKTASGFAQ
jgi:hypothetical protein